MTEPFLGQISLVPYNFEPRGWAFCNGQLLSIAQHSALFSLLGTTYGGDGRTTFALPDLRGRSVIHNGRSQGPGLNPTMLGQRGGVEYISIQTQNLPAHSHAAAFTPTFDTNSSNGDTTADLKVTEGTGDTANPSLAKSLASKATIGLDTVNNLSTTNATTTITDAITGIQSGGSSMTGGHVTVGNTGGNQPLYNKDPFLVMNYVIALVGVFPSRN